jgi:hypothetical protein
MYSFHEGLKQFCVIRWYCILVLCLLVYSRTLFAGVFSYSVCWCILVLCLECVWGASSLQPHVIFPLFVYRHCFSFYNEITNNRHCLVIAMIILIKQINCQKFLTHI